MHFEIKTKKMYEMTDNMHSKYDNMHKSVMFYTYILIDNHIITCINFMLSPSTRCL